jgi:antitoxin component YwqK of YwqJK toxin-antitoxin module
MKYLTFAFILIFTPIFCASQGFYLGGNSLEFDSLGNYTGKIQTDTIKAKWEGVFLIGNIVLTQDNTKTELKVGVWTEYYHSGKKKSQGNYSLTEYIHCCSGGPCLMHYAFKTGLWTYYYESGQIETIGIYNNKSEKIDTNCGGKTLGPQNRIDKTWKHYDENGNSLKITKEVKDKLEHIEWTGW